MALTAGCAHTASERDLVARVDALVEPLVSANEFSGAIVMTRSGSVVYRRGFGMANHEAGIEFTPDTPCDGGSMAKTLTAAVIWELAEEGRVELDAQVTRYLPEYPHEETTVRHLISHSNGLPPYYEFFDPFFASDEVRTTGAMLRVVGREAPRPSFPPGSRFEYSNFGFDVAALLMERVTGRSYEEVLRETYFDRLGMTRTFARPARFSDWPGVRTRGYRWKDGAWEPFDAYDMEAFLGASNLQFTASDLARWASANAAGTALPADVFAAGQKRSRIDGRPSPITGLSWYCDDGGVKCYYTGSLNAFHAFAYWDRGRNESVAFVSNSSIPPWRVISLQRSLVDVLAGRAPSTGDPERFEMIARDARSALAGVYEVDDLGTIRVKETSSGLSILINDGLEFDAFHVAPDVFYVPGPDYWIAFRDGQPPSAMHVRSMFVDTIGRRVP